MIVPILFRGASILPEEQLPEDIRPVVTRQAIEVGDKHFDLDAETVCRFVRRHFPIPCSPVKRHLLLYKPRTSTAWRGWFFRLTFYVFLFASLAWTIGLPATLPGRGFFETWEAFWVRVTAAATAILFSIIVQRYAYRLDASKPLFQNRMPAVERSRRPDR